MRLVSVALVLVCLGCASAPIRQVDLPLLDRADALVLEGCYDCLIEARTTYARLAAGRARPLIVGRLFETEILIAVRERELAIDAGPALARARALMPELPALTDAPRVLALVEMVPPDSYGSPRRQIAEFRRAQNPRVPRLTDELAWLETVPFAAHVRLYLTLAVDCAYRTQPRFAGAAARATTPDVPIPADAPPLVRFRKATCARIDSAPLEAVRAAVPRFVETAYFLGRNAVARVQETGDTVKTRAIVQEAYGRFPQSPSVTYLNGSFNQLIGDCKAALGFYDETIALTPAHEDALLGRTVCLSFLKRTDEAIAAATHLIELKTDNVVDAYYWRAWNHHFRQDLPPARADIERAKALGSNGRIHTLAGVIAHDQDDLTPAEQDLRIARGLSEGDRNCVAAWYLGLVLMKREQWTPSADQFAHAMACYDLNVRESLAGLERIRARENIDEEFRAKQIVGFEAALVEDRRQYHAAAFNAANHYARGGAIDKAKALIEVAAQDPALAQRVADLRRAMGGGRHF